MTRVILTLFILLGFILPAQLFAAVAFDVGSESHTGISGSISEASFSWTHTPSGTPRGVLVFVMNNGSASDLVSQVTYGGTALTEVAEGVAVDSAGEIGRVSTFFLGTGISAGAQTVAVTRTNNTVEMYAVAMTVTAAANTSATGYMLLQEDGTLAEQSVDDGSPGTNSMRFAGLFTGHNQVTTDVSVGANSTAIHDIDFGGQGVMAVRETTAGQGARSVGFSAATQNRAAVHLAVIESATIPSVRRKMHLFEGFKIKFFGGRIILFGN